MSQTFWLFGSRLTIITDHTTTGWHTPRGCCGLVVAAPSGFARLIAATGTLSKTETTDMELFMQICAEIGDEILGPPGALPVA